MLFYLYYYTSVNYTLIKNNWFWIAQKYLKKNSRSSAKIINPVKTCTFNFGSAFSTVIFSGWQFLVLPSSTGNIYIRVHVIKSIINARFIFKVYLRKAQTVVRYLNQPLDLLAYSGCRGHLYLSSLVTVLKLLINKV